MCALWNEERLPPQWTPSEAIREPFILDGYDRKTLQQTSTSLLMAQWAPSRRWSSQNMRKRNSTEWWYFFVKFDPLYKRGLYRESKNCRIEFLMYLFTTLFFPKSSGPLLVLRKKIFLMLRMILSLLKDDDWNIKLQYANEDLIHWVLNQLWGRYQHLQKCCCRFWPIYTAAGC